MVYPRAEQRVNQLHFLRLMRWCGMCTNFVKQITTLPQSNLCRDDTGRNLFTYNVDQREVNCRGMRQKSGYILLLFVLWGLMGRFNPTLQIFRFSSLEKRKDFGSASQAWCSRNSFQLLIMFSFLYVDFCRFAAELKKILWPFHY